MADSLGAIRKLVFEEKKLSIEKLTEILDHNFKGFEKEHRWMLDCPKFGNDNDNADAMRTEADNHLNTFVRDMAARVGLHSYLNVIINNDANTTMGMLTGASPDGRKAFTPMANGNAASGGADKNGLTAYLNSIVKPDNTIHAGAVQNLKFSRELQTTYRNQTESLLQTYFKLGGAQLMINCLNRNDLENAMREPEKYGSLIVRVGGLVRALLIYQGRCNWRYWGENCTSINHSGMFDSNGRPKLATRRKIKAILFHRCPGWLRIQLRVF